LKKRTEIEADRGEIEADRGEIEAGTAAAEAPPYQGRFHPQQQPCEKTIKKEAAAAAAAAAVYLCVYHALPRSAMFPPSSCTRILRVHRKPRRWCHQSDRRWFLSPRRQRQQQQYHRIRMMMMPPSARVAAGNFPGGRGAPLTTPRTAATLNAAGHQLSPRTAPTFTNRRDVGPWSLVVGPWSLVVGPWSLVLRRWSLVVVSRIAEHSAASQQRRRRYSTAAGTYCFRPVPSRPVPSRGVVPTPYSTGNRQSPITNHS
jgi:hypothetical protein